MTDLTRRRLLGAGPLAAAAVFLPAPAREATRLLASLVEASVLDPDDRTQLTEAALTAARSAGATYADVHLRVVRTERIGGVEGTSFQGNSPPFTQLTVGFGVRALVNGYWGHAGRDGLIDADIAARLGHDATRYAKIAATGAPRVVELAPAPVSRGSWTMPVEIDPFTVSYEEKYDTLMAMDDFIARVQSGDRIATPLATAHYTGAMLRCTKEECTFASSEGSYTTQTTFATEGGFSVAVPADWISGRGTTTWADPYVSLAGAGWEYMRDTPYRDYVPDMIERALAARRPKPAQVGRYDIVFDAVALGNILARTIGTATQLDRAMGYRANGQGTSYLNDPLSKLGHEVVASPLVTVSANRSMAGGAATVRWDDEGVVPSETPLVTRGVLTDYQTTRESASWLAPYYRSAGRPVRSNGCASAVGTYPVGVRTPNLVLHSADGTTRFDDLVKTVKKGLAVTGGSAYTDFQQLNGAGRGGIVYEITDGRITGTVMGAQFLFRAPEFWKSVVALGGSATARRVGMLDSGDGFSVERRPFTVDCVDAVVTGVAIADRVDR